MPVACSSLREAVFPSLKDPGTIPDAEEETTQESGDGDESSETLSSGHGTGTVFSNSQGLGSPAQDYFS